MYKVHWTKSLSIKLDTRKIYAMKRVVVPTPSIPHTLYYMIILYPLKKWSITNLTLQYLPT